MSALDLWRAYPTKPIGDFGLGIVRFWSKVARGAPDACWEWLGGKHARGDYGVFYESGRTWYAHRFVFHVTVRPLMAGEVLRHSCDNPGCVNPSHLEPGQQIDNVRDRVDRERNARGGRNGRAKLTEQTVRAIRIDRRRKLSRGRKLQHLTSSCVPRQTGEEMGVVAMDQSGTCSLRSDASEGSTAVLTRASHQQDQQGRRGVQRRGVPAVAVPPRLRSATRTDVRGAAGGGP